MHASARYHTTDHHHRQVPAVNTLHVLGQGQGQGHASEVWVAVPASAFGAGVDLHPPSWAQHHCNDLHLLGGGGGCDWRTSTGAWVDQNIIGSESCMALVLWELHFGTSKYWILLSDLNIELQCFNFRNLNCLNFLLLNHNWITILGGLILKAEFLYFTSFFDCCCFLLLVRP